MNSSLTFLMIYIVIRELLVFLERREYKLEIKDLLNRVMARDYPEYKTLEITRDKVPVKSSISKLEKEE